MDIGDLGFLIIAFIAFIVNFIVKSNKEKVEAQKQNQNTAKTESPEPWEVEETLPPLFESLFNPKKDVEENRKTPTSSLPIPSYPYERLEKQVQPVQEGMSSISESLFKEDNMDSVSYQDEDSEGDISYTNELFHGNITEELKKAIIYSEILHRKYE